MGTLYYGECSHTATLDILRRYIADESIDLVYLDLPFNSPPRRGDAESLTPTPSAFTASIGFAPANGDSRLAEGRRVI